MYRIVFIELQLLDLHDYNDTMVNIVMNNKSFKILITLIHRKSYITFKIHRQSLRLFYSLYVVTFYIIYFMNAYKIKRIDNYHSEKLFLFEYRILEKGSGPTLFIFI